jgi:hypothetical protein
MTNHDPNKRIVQAPNNLTPSNISSAGPITVLLGPDEDVEWLYSSHGPNGSYVYGYVIIGRKTGTKNN